MEAKALEGVARRRRTRYIFHVMSRIRNRRGANDGGYSHAKSHISD